MQIWVVTHHYFGITAVIAQMSFCRESSGASRNIGFFLWPIEESRTKELPSCSIPYLLVAYNTLARQLFCFHPFFSVLIYSVMEHSFQSSVHHSHIPVNKLKLYNFEAWCYGIVHPSLHLISLCVLTIVKCEDLCYSFFV